MIKLIKGRTHNPKSNNPTYRKECPHCGAIFEYNRLDIDCYVVESGEVTCPDCKLVSAHHFWYRKRKNTYEEN